MSYALAPVTGGASLLVSDIAKNFIAPKPPKPDTSAADLAEKQRLGVVAAQNAVQTKEAEARRQRAAKRTSSVLTGGLGLPGTAPTATATLQPNEARKSVLG
jgi:hypothetical protein